MTEDRYIIGIDNGLDGGLVTLTGDGGMFENVVMPTVKMGKKREYNLMHLAGFFGGAQMASPAVFIEKAQAMPRQGVSSTFNTGYGYGLMVGMLSMGVRLISSAVSAAAPPSPFHPRTRPLL